MNPHEVYQKNQVTTAKPEELTLMLYNGAVKFLQQAKMAINNKDLEKAHSLIIRTQEIITELTVTLNTEYEISKSLLTLYEYIKRRLIEANVSKDITILEEIEGLVQQLKLTWSQAMKAAKSV